jgi:hypothetical protein
MRWRRARADAIKALAVLAVVGALDSTGCLGWLPEYLTE